MLLPALHFLFSAMVAVVNFSNLCMKVDFSKLQEI